MRHVYAAAEGPFPVVIHALVVVACDAPQKDGSPMQVRSNIALDNAQLLLLQGSTLICREVYSMSAIRISKVQR